MLERSTLTWVKLIAGSKFGSILAPAIRRVTFSSFHSHGSELSHSVHAVARPEMIVRPCNARSIGDEIYSAEATHCIGGNPVGLCSNFRARTTFIPRHSSERVS